MILIISHHFFGHGGWHAVSGSANSFFMYLTSALFRPSVNVFVLISAYFMCMHDDMRVPWKKLGKLWLSVFFYSAILYTVFTATGVYQFDIHSLISTLFPVLFGKYWFVSAYFIMMILSPFLNVIVKRLEKSQFTILCIIIIIFAALQDIGVLSGTFPLSAGYNGIWFCLLYFLAAYIRKYDIAVKSRTVWIIGSLLFAGVVMLMTFVWTSPNYISIVTIYMSVFIILAAKQISITNSAASKIICFISKLTFGVYLIHDSNEMRGYMYENIFHSSQFIPSKYAFLIYLGFIAATFAACALAEWIRQLGFSAIKKLIHCIFGSKLNQLKESVKSLISKISDKINSSDISIAQ